jgi:hypothetical protein
MLRVKLDRAMDEGAQLTRTVVMEAQAGGLKAGNGVRRFAVVLFPGLPMMVFRRPVAHGVNGIARRNCLPQSNFDPATLSNATPRPRPWPQWSL